ncbi:DUF7557 family protein [Halorientalis marina]|nr:hypothetical protein [Halorientalis marina]
MATNQTDSTTIRVTRPVKNRLEQLKPYDSMSYDEFLAEMADTYEGNV